MWSLALLAAVAVAFSPPRDPSRLPRALSAGSAAEEAPAIKLLSLDCTGTLFTLSASIGTLYHRGITRGLAGEFDVAVPSAAEISKSLYRRSATSSSTLPSSTSIRNALPRAARSSTHAHMVHGSSGRRKCSSIGSNEGDGISIATGTGESSSSGVALRSSR